MSNTTSSSDHSITQWLHALRDGDDNAATHIWKHYFSRLSAIASQHLQTSQRRMANEQNAPNGPYDLSQFVAGATQLYIRATCMAWRRPHLRPVFAYTV